MTFPPAEPRFALLVDWLRAWMGSQRWYANKGTLPALEEIGNLEVPSPDGARFVIHLLLDHTVGKPTLYQVPLSYRREPLALGWIGELEGWHVHDAPHDPDFARALLATMVGEVPLHGDRASGAGVRSNPDATSPESPTGDLNSRVLSGEQSNTSIIYDDAALSGGGGAPAIVKLFRALHHGDNPEVELQTALAAAGSTAVPRPIGAVVATWGDRGRSGGLANGHLAFGQEFLPGAVDAWRVALAAAEAGVDFSVEARELGIATAGVHATLAATLPTRPATADDIAIAVAGMRARLEQAIAEVPELLDCSPAISATFDRAAAAVWPAQQRIHGDLHLGQVLAAPGRGWVIVDFEGEPLRAMNERSRIDSPMRDVAGMLRSFDYVAGSLAVSGSHRDARDWAAAARAAYSEGYSAASGRDIRSNGALVDAFEFDKALYETVYEARNRPDWLEIPVAAIQRLAR
ncbi:MAG: maltokinase N-terminal cap-like domain-containing protein [Rhodoglobus sp.]